MNACFLTFYLQSQLVVLVHGAGLTHDVGPLALGCSVEGLLQTLHHLIDLHKVQVFCIIV